MDTTERYMTKSVGTEYWGDWFFDDTSTSNTESRLKWRVVGIVPLPEFGKWGKIIDAEKVEAIQIETRERILF